VGSPRDAPREVMHMITSLTISLGFIKLSLFFHLCHGNEEICLPSSGRYELFSHRIIYVATYAQLG
jgi:hypothetical protein